jgi:hypothetical protein
MITDLGLKLHCFLVRKVSGWAVTVDNNGGLQCGYGSMDLAMESQVS